MGLRISRCGSYDDLGRVPFEVMFEEELPYSSADPISLAIGEAGSLPTVPSHSASLEHGMALLFDDGVVRMYGQEDSGQPASSRPWPTRYLHTGDVSLPALPQGVTDREYCDIEILPDGDLVVTFAQWPTVTVGQESFAREGWVRYNNATSTWETAVTSYFGVDFLHPEKGGAFSRGSCMAVDTNYWFDYELLLTSNLAQTNSTLLYQTLWNFDLNTSGTFLLNWYRTVPSPNFYGDVQGLAAVTGDVVLIQHDYDGPTDKADRVRLLDTSSSSLVELGVSWQGTELGGVVALPVEKSASCIRWVGLTAREPTGTTDTCGTFFEFELSECN